jgi:hypothetical protein
VIRLSCSWVIVGLISAATVGAQDTVVAHPGAHARLQLPHPVGKWTGTIERIGADTILFRACRSCPPEAVPRTAVSRFEVDIGSGGHPIIGAAIGLLGGAAIGGIQLARCERQRRRSSGEGPPCGIGAAVSIYGGAFVGTLLGAAIGGWLIPKERWRPARWP